MEIRKYTNDACQRQHGVTIQVAYINMNGHWKRKYIQSEVEAVIMETKIR